MKKLFITIAAILLGAAFASAQDLASVTETFNNGAIALQADRIIAIEDGKIVKDERIRNNVH